jgi:hypothetical protein
MTSNKEEKEEFSPIVESLIGSFKEPENFDYKQGLVEEQSKKYL